MLSFVFAARTRLSSSGALKARLAEPNAPFEVRRQHLGRLSSDVMFRHWPFPLDYWHQGCTVGKTEVSNTVTRTIQLPRSATFDTGKHTYTCINTHIFTHGHILTHLISLSFIRIEILFIHTCYTITHTHNNRNVYEHREFIFWKYTCVHFPLFKKTLIWLQCKLH